MFGFKFISKISAVLFCLSVSSLAVANPFTVTFSDTLSARSDTPPFNVGEAITISIVLDNGGTTAASQTWTSADVVSITFSMNDAPNTITTVFSPAGMNVATGDFVTDASGVLTAVLSDWADDNNPTVITTDDPDTPIDLWYIAGYNEVYANYNTSASMNNVGNNIIPAFWTNPVAAGAPAPAAATPIPTMGIWSIGILSGMIGLLGLYHRRRKYG